MLGGLGRLNWLKLLSRLERNDRFGLLRGLKGNNRPWWLGGGRSRLEVVKLVIYK